MCGWILSPCLSCNKLSPNPPWLPLIRRFSIPSFVFIFWISSKTWPNFLKLKLQPQKNYIISSLQVCTQLSLNNQFFYFSTAVISGNIWAICPCRLNWYLIYCLQTSLASLMTTLSQSHPYFVRCVKPNEKKVWSNHPQVIHQVLRGVSSPGANVLCRRKRETWNAVVDSRQRRCFV